MKDTAVTRRQFAAVIFTAMLSPQLRVLPRAAVLIAGKGAWLSIFPAALVLFALSLLMDALRRRQLPGEGMATLILRVLGPTAGRLMLILYAAWFLLYAGFTLRAGAQRLTATVYLQSGPDPFVIIMLILCLPAVLGTLRATARMGVIVRFVLFAVLLFAAVFSAPNVSLENLFPLFPEDVPDIIRAAWPIIAVGGLAALFSFLNGYVEPLEKPRTWTLRHLALFSLVGLLLCLETVGTFGEVLTTRLSFPFFTMVRDISLFHVAQRVEAVVIVVWVFTEFMLCILLLRSAFEALRTVFGLPKSEILPTFDFHKGRWLYLVEAIAVFLCAHFIAPTAEALQLWSELLIPLLMIVFVFGGFPLLWIIGKLRKKI